MNKSVGYSQAAAGTCLFLVAFALLVPLTRTAMLGTIPLANTLFFPYLAGGAGIWYAIILAFRGLENLEPTAKDLLCRDSRPPVVLLRSFLNAQTEPDGTSSPAPAPAPALSAPALPAPALVDDPLTIPAESAVNLFLNAVGPVVAPIKSGQRLAARGAAPTCVAESAWQREVSAWMACARLTVVLASQTAPGTLWELDHAVATLDPLRFMLYFPMESGDANVREARYAAYRQVVSKVFPRSLPFYLGDSIFIRFEPDWTPHPTRLAELEPWVDPTYHPLSLWDTPTRVRNATLALILTGVVAELAFSLYRLGLHP